MGGIGRCRRAAPASAALEAHPSEISRVASPWLALAEFAHRLRLSRRSSARICRVINAHRRDSSSRRRGERGGRRRFFLGRCKPNSARVRVICCRRVVIWLSEGGQPRMPTRFALQATHSGTRATSHETDLIKISTQKRRGQPKPNRQSGTKAGLIVRFLNKSVSWLHPLALRLAFLLHDGVHECE